MARQTMISGGGQSYRAGQHFEVMFAQEGYALIAEPTAPERRMTTIPFRNGGSQSPCRAQSDVLEQPKGDPIRPSSDHQEVREALPGSCADEILPTSELIFRLRPRSRPHTPSDAYLPGLKLLMLLSRRARPG